MMSEFPIKKLEGIVERVCVGYVGTCNKDYTESGIGVPMIRTTNLTGTAINYEQMKFISNEFHEKNIKSQLKRGDILVARHGDSGLPSIYESDEEANCLNVVIVKLTINDDLIDNYYILYALKSPFVVHQIKSAVGGSVQGVVNTKAIAGLDIPFPKRCVREEVVQHLFNIDKKIELNRQTNQTLEQIAQAIFKSWFVDFEPVKAKIKAKQEWVKSMTAKDGGNDESAEVNFVELAAMCAISGKTEEQLKGLDEATLQQLKTTAALFPDALLESELGEVPEEWELGELKAIAEFSIVRVDTSELTLENYISTENMLEGKNGVSIASSLPAVKTVPRFEPNQILISNIRPYFMKIWLARFNGGRSNDVLGIEAKKPESVEYLYNLLYQDVFFNFMMMTSKGAKMPRGDKEAIMGWVCVQPSSAIKKAYSVVVRHFYEIIDSNNKENGSLEKIRDALLPQLLSGEIDLSENEIISEVYA